MTDVKTVPVLSIRDLTVEFHTTGGVLRAVDHVSLDVPRGKTLGLVGESGSGKTVTALSVLRLVASPPGRIVSGEIRFDDYNLLSLPERTLRTIRGNRIAMIFQDPMTSLNPVYSAGEQVAEAVRAHERTT